MLKQRLASGRLLTLTGPGGCGKTRLALEIASNLASEFSNEVYFADFAPVSDGAVVPFIMASALGVREQQGRPILETLAAALRPRTVLVIFDNCEHLVSECARLAESLLRFCPRLKILATSREALGAMGEVIWKVPPLALPQSDQSTPAELSKVESVQLFVERASALMPGFELSAGNASLVARICRELDGLPLAIELAAARCRTLSLKELSERLGERFSLLTGGQRTAPPRHQTLQATIDWSYTLLDTTEQVVLQRLSVFAGGWTLSAAEAVCSERILDILSHLIDKSLVLKQERNNEVRYSMLETIRRYAWERLGSEGQIEPVRKRHLDFFLHLAEEAAPWLLRSEQLTWLKRLHEEDANLRAALSWSFQQGGDYGYRMVSALLQYWLVSGTLNEWSVWADKLVGTSGDAPGGTRVRSLLIGGTFARLAHDWARADTLLSQGLILSEQLRDNQGIAWALRELGVTAHLQGEHKRGIDLLARSLALYRQNRDKAGIGETLLWSADALMRHGDLAAARAYFSESLHIFRELRERKHTAWSLGGLGDIARLEGNYSEAARLLREALELRFEVGATFDICFVMEALANLAAQTHAPGRAARLWSAAERLREYVGMPIPPTYQSDYAPLVDTVRLELGALVFSAAWSEGRAMTLEQAVKYALGENETSSDTSKPTSQSAIEPLTPRELQILRLINAGLSNREIAEQLVLSLGTVKWYTTAIYGKLRVQSRTQAVALAKAINLL